MEYGVGFACAFLCTPVGIICPNTLGFSIDWYRVVAGFMDRIQFGEVWKDNYKEPQGST